MEKDILNWIQTQQAPMETTLHQWCALNTGTENIQGLDTFRALVIESFKSLNVKIDEVLPADVHEITDNGEPRQVPVGKSLRIQNIRSGMPKILLVGHMDTVFPIDSAFQQLTPLADRALQGPGVTDMKGGILVILKALEAFEQSPLANQLSWEVFLNADEETGSRGSMPALLESASTANIGLGYEPCMPNAALAGQRKGSANYAVHVIGMAAHAGREFNKGRNALTALCRFCNTLDQLNKTRDTITLNIARIHGGGPLNVVPDTAVGRFNIRIESKADQVWFEGYLAQVIAEENQQDGFKFELSGGFTRPPKLINTQTQKLYDLVQECGRALGLEIQYQATGGCCDGNNLAAAGVPTIDTLGVHGANIHSHQEFIWLDSLSQRAQLSFLILSRLAQSTSSRHSLL